MHFKDLPVLVTDINVSGLYLLRFMMSASNIVEPTLLIQICFLYPSLNFFNGIMMGSPVKLTIAFTLFGIPFFMTSA